MSEQVKSGKFSDVPIRVKSWVYIIVVFFTGAINIYTMALFVAALTYQGNREFFKILVSKISSKFYLASVFLLQIVLLIFANVTQYLLISTIILLGFVFVLLYNQIKISKQFWLIISGLIISIISFSFLYFIRFLSSDNFDNLGFKLLIYIVFLTELNDVFQYLSGKFFGKHAIVPKVSPNKTVEGLVGAVFLSIGLSNLLGFLLFPFYSVLTFTLFGLFFSILGFWGDVFMSYIKRFAKVKDSGNLIPGHGGLLDRMDSLFFNAPIFYVLCKYIVL